MATWYRDRYGEIHDPDETREEEIKLWCELTLRQLAHLEAPEQEAA